MVTDVIRSGNFNEIESKFQINSRNLNQAVKFTTVLDGPLISFLWGFSSKLAFEGFAGILEKDINGDLVNMAEKSDDSALRKYDLLEKYTGISVGDYVKSDTDVMPSFSLVPSAAMTASAADKLLSVTANGAYHAIQGNGLFNPRTNELMIVSQTHDSDAGIVLERGARGTTVGTVLTTDTLIVTGIALDMYTPQVLASKPIPRRSSRLVNGFFRLFTLGTAISNTLTEDSLLYNGDFFDLINEDLKRAHKSQLLNALLYHQVGAITDTSAPLDNINQFNGWTYWAQQNSVTTGFANIGALTTAKFEALMTWFEPYKNIGLSTAPMVYICGSTAYQALQRFLKQGILVTTDEGFIPKTVGGRVERYITNFGKMVYVCVDYYLDQIGRGGDIFMSAEGNLNLYVGKDEFLKPDNIAITKKGYLEGDSRFCQFIADYSVNLNQRADLMCSYFSLLPRYTELVSYASGITVA